MEDARARNRQQVLEVATVILERDGAQAVSTRSVAAAAGIRVPVAIGDALILSAVRESGGFALAVDEDEIFDARDRVARADGLLLCPEGAATARAWEMAVERGLVGRGERAMLFNCATGLKYPLPPGGRALDRHAPIDYPALAAAA